MTIDAYTYGDTPAAVTLAEILEELGDGKIRQRVGHIFGTYCAGFWAIMDVENNKTRESLFFVWRNYYKDRVFNDKLLPDTVKSRLWNVMVSKYKIDKRSREEEEGAWEEMPTDLEEEFS